MITPIFFKEKPLRTLVSLAKKDRVWYASMLCKEIDCTYPHMMKVLQMFETEGLVESEGQGRIKIIRLTDKGEDLARDFETVLRRIEKSNKPKQS
jgi:predicted transcriptional regulator